jgi:hypothetical protein
MTWRRRRQGSRSEASALAVVLAAGVLIAACGDMSPTQRPSKGPSGPASSPSVAPTTEASQRPVPSSQPAQTIEQPPVPSDVPLAPDSARVDLAMPTFSNPTRITNPLFPVSGQESVLMLGKVDDKPFRTEVTLLPFTRIVEWEGLQVETVVSQYQAYLDGRIQEIAYDLYAQADDGSVWYFGEDVSDFEDGAIVTKEGTWLAGKDAPAAMIMPADPKVGDVFRTENSPGFAFEEVTVKSVGEALDGPLGPVAGGIIVSELHMDGAIEDKTFAPGYGEFLTAGGGDLEALALGVPTDATRGPLPATLADLATGAATIFGAAGARDWRKVAAENAKMPALWKAYRTQSVPRLIAPQMTAALDVLGQTVAAKDMARTRQAAINVARSIYDLQLRFRPAAEVNLARFDLWAAQTLIDAAAKDSGSVRGDAFTLGFIRDRILKAVDPANLGRINTQLLALQIAALDEDFAAATNAAPKLREILAGLQP